MKKLLLFAALLLAAAGCSKDESPSTSTDKWDSTIATSFANGDYESGTTSYTIETSAQLAYLAELVNSGETMAGVTFTLAANLNLQDNEWTPIGISSSYPFKGTFYGGNHTISGLYINNSVLRYLGLFGYSSSATIQNISVSGDITGTAASYACIGGISGGAANSKISNCYSSVSLKGVIYDYVGGVVGYVSNPSSILTNCYSSGDIEAGDQSRVGGVAGYLGSSAKIVNCYSSVGVKGGDSAKIGGVVGDIAYATKLTNCYSSGVIEGGSGAYIGGVAGYITSTSSSVTIEYCYWDSTVAGASVEIYGVNSDGSEGFYTIFTDNAGKTTAEMQAADFVTLLNENVTRYNNTSPATSASTWKAVSGGYPKFSL